MQNKHQTHDWEITETKSYPNGVIDTELCPKCKAIRIIQYPPGMIIESNPKPVPKYCTAQADNFAI